MTNFRPRTPWVSLFCCCLCFTGLMAQRDTPPYFVSLEAECATIGASWQTVTDSAASGRRYVTGRAGEGFDDTPPPDLSQNHLTFTTEIPYANEYHLFARLNSFNPDSDSFWVRVNGGAWIEWTYGLRTGGEYLWRELTGGPYFLPAGTVDIQVAVREEGTDIDKIYLTSGREQPSGFGVRPTNCDNGQPVDCEQYPDACRTATFAEAECAPAGVSWFRAADDSASNRRYASVRGDIRLDPPPNEVPFDDQLVIDTDLNGEGEYHLYFRMRSRGVGRNSFWVRVDTSEWIEFSENTAGEPIETEGFEWVQVTDDGQPLRLNLAAGRHRITILGREPGAYLDKIYFGLEAPMPAAGRGTVAPNCSADQIVSNRPELDLSAKLELFPNPVGGQLNYRYASPTSGTVRLMVYDAAGRRLLERTLTKSDGELKGYLPTDGLPAGMYRLLLVGEGGIVSRPFVRQ